MIKDLKVGEGTDGAFDYLDEIVYMAKKIYAFSNLRDWLKNPSKLPEELNGTGVVIRDHVESILQMAQNVRDRLPKANKEDLIKKAISA